MPAIKKILVIRLSSLGDIVLSFPLLKKLKEKFQGSEIHFLTKKNYEEITFINPDIDQRIFLGDSLTDVRKQIKKANYDLILDIHKNYRSFYVSFMNSKKVSRYKKENIKKFLLVNFKIYMFKQIIPVYNKYLLTLKEYLEETDYGFSITNLMFDKNKFIEENYIVISPASRHFTKTYPKEKFVEYINELNRVTELSELEELGELTRESKVRLPSKVKIVIVGDNSENDKSICEYIEMSCKNILNLCGKLNIKELANVLCNSEYVVCNDSAILHLSEAVGKNVIAIFGSTVREFGFFPQLKNSKVLENKGLKCRPCTHVGRESCPLRHFRCMKDIQLAVKQLGS